MARIGLEHLTSNRYTAYPFDADTVVFAESLDAVDPGATFVAMLQDFFLDAVLSSESESNSWYLESIRFLGADQPEFTFRDATNTSLITAAATATLVEIQQATTSGYYILSLDSAPDNFTFRATCDNSFYAYLKKLRDSALPEFIFDNLKFDESAIDYQPPKVKSFTLLTGSGTSPVISGDVQILEGYNVEIVLDDTQSGGVSDLTAVTLSATPGAGDGVVPCDDSDSGSPETTRGSIIPDNLGRIRLEGDACYAISPISSGLQIQGSCYACCTCSDYEEVAEYLNELIQRTHALRLGLEEDVHPLYDEAVQDYNNRHFPALRKGFLTVSGAPGAREEIDVCTDAIVVSTKIDGAKHGNIIIRLENKAEAELSGTISFASDNRFLTGVYYIGDDEYSLTGPNWAGDIPPGSEVMISARLTAPLCGIVDIGLTGIIPVGGILGPVDVVATYTINADTPRNYTDEETLVWPVP